MSIVFLNGQFLPIEEAKISPLDRGFLFADGVYEVIPAYQGKPFTIEKHLKRLAWSLNEIRLDLPDYCPIDKIPKIINQLIQQNGGGNLSLYLQVTRGCAPVRDHGFPSDGPNPTLFIMCSPLKTPRVEQLNQASGASAITLEDIRWTRCDIKSISLLPNQLLRQQALDVGADEAILHREGFVTEGAASNIFIVENQVLKTPPQVPAILSGITRDLILGLAQEHHIAFEECPISLKQLAAADEIWATSSTREILPITKLDNKPVGSGEIGSLWFKMAQLYNSAKKTLYT